MEDVKKLSKAQLKKLEQHSQEMNLVGKDSQIARLKLDIARKELTLLSANYTLKSKEVVELENEFKREQEKQKIKKQKHLEYVTKIKDDLDLPDRWGYDPMTGEIE